MSCLSKGALPPRFGYFVTRQSTQNEGAQPLLRCMALSNANEMKMRHFAHIMRNEQISCGNHSSVTELFSMSVGWRDDKMLQDALTVCALAETTHAARGAAPR